MSIAELGRFGEAAENAAEAIGLAEPTHHAYTVSQAHRAASMLHLLEGDWTKARSLIEHWIAVLRSRNVVLQLPIAVAASAWVLAQLGEASEALNRLREGEQLLDRAAARGFIGYRSWAWLGRACLLLDRLDEAQRLSDRAVESSRSHPGFAAHELQLLGDIATHPDRFDAVMTHLDNFYAEVRVDMGLVLTHRARPLAYRRIFSDRLRADPLFRRAARRGQDQPRPEHCPRPEPAVRAHVLGRRAGRS